MVDHLLWLFFLPWLWLRLFFPLWLEAGEACLEMHDIDASGMHA